MKYKMTINDPLTGHVCVDKVDVSGTCSSKFMLAGKCVCTSTLR